MAELDHGAGLGRLAELDHVAELDHGAGLMAELDHGAGLGRDLPEACEARSRRAVKAVSRNRRIKRDVDSVQYYVFVFAFFTKKRYRTRGEHTSVHNTHVRAHTSVMQLYCTQSELLTSKPVSCAQERRQHQIRHPPHQYPSHTHNSPEYIRDIAIVTHKRHAPAPTRQKCTVTISNRSVSLRPR